MSVNDLKLFWELFEKENEAYLQIVRESITPLIREIIDPIITEAGLDPDDFKIVWKFLK